MSVFDNPRELYDWYERLKSDQANARQVFQEIADNELGMRDFSVGGIEATSRGRDRSALLYDTTALMGSQLLAGGLHGLLTNPSAPWFELAVDPRAMQSGDVMAWLEDAKDRMRMVFNSTASGFSTQIAEDYLDISSFGNCSLWIDERGRFPVRFSARDLRENYVEQDADGEIDVVFREIELTVRQFAQRFPDAKVEEVENAFKSKQPQQRVTVIQLVTRSDDPYAGTNRFRKPWVAVSFIKGRSDIQVLERRGFNENPCLHARWSVDTSEVLGRGPGHIALADAKTLNVMWRTILVGGQKAVDPPLLVTDEAVLSGIRTQPGGVNVVQDRPGIGGAPEAIRPLDNRARIDIGIALIERKTDQVQQAFWAQLLKMHQDPQMTATQVLQLSSQAQRLMAPMLGRLEKELLQPIIRRTFNIMMRKGLFARPIPMALAGQPIRVSYVSPITRAQQQSEADATLRTWLGAAQIAQASGSADALDMLDPDASVQILHQANAAPLSIIRDVREVQERRQARSELAEEQVAMEQAGQGAEVLKAISDAVGQNPQAIAA